MKHSGREVFGMNLVDLGVELPKPIEVRPEKATEKSYPVLYLSGDQIPGYIAEAEKGTKCLVVAIANVASRTERDIRARDKELSVELEFLQMGAKPYRNKRAKEMTDEELGESIREGTGSKDDEEY